MPRKKVAILGATGAVGQKLVGMLANHPWFQISELLASERSAGMSYSEAIRSRQIQPIPESLAELQVDPVGKLDLDADFIFSALPSDIAQEQEPRYARQGYAISSNASAFRLDPHVPLVIPEINPDHLQLLELQSKLWDGKLVTDPNCTAIILCLSLKPLLEFEISRLRVATMQAISGAGYEGLPSMAIQDNLIPYISQEEFKVENEPLKILGSYRDGRIIPPEFRISASCHRVPVLDGHTEVVWVEFKHRIELDQLKEAFLKFDPKLNLPSAPSKPIILRNEIDRPQPRLDRDAGAGMSVSVGRLRQPSPNELLYIVTGHNLIRGAAGAALLNAELMLVKGYV